MLFNSIILSTFAPRTKFTASIESTRLRHQFLSCIYVNILTTIAVILLDAITHFYFNSPTPFYMASLVIPSALASLYYIRYNRLNTAINMMAFYINMAGFIISDFGRRPAIGFTELPVVLLLNYFFTNSMRTFALSLCLHVIISFINFFNAIQDLMTSEQPLERYNQYAIIVCVAFVAQAYFIALLLIQKYLDEHVWSIAISNYRRSEILTQNVLESSQAKDRFISSLSHEIRNPLNSLKGVIDYLSQVVTIPDQLKLLDSAKIGCEILLNMANNVLDAAKLKADKMELSLMDSDLRVLIHKVLTVNSEKLKEKSIGVKVFIDRMLPNKLLIDPSRITQIMINVLSNALKFTPKGGEIAINIIWCSPNTSGEILLLHDEILNAKKSYQPPERSTNYSSLRMNRVTSTDEFNMDHLVKRFENLNVTRELAPKTFRHVNESKLSSQESELWTIIQADSQKYHDNASNIKTGFLKIQVTDNGPGIPADHIPKLFEMFVQAHQSVVTMYGGTGLGLWICKQLCRKMNGDIKLYSQYQQGTSLVFYIPVKSSQDATASNVTEVVRCNRTVTVMIVDDYANNRDLHRLLVEKEGAHTVLCSSGDDVVDRFKRHPEGYFSFIMMDILMPGMNGFIAAQRIRDWEKSEGRGNRVDIYFVSGEYYSEAEVMYEFRRSGSVKDTKGIKHIVKPVDADVLKKTIQQYK